MWWHPTICRPQMRLRFPHCAKMPMLSFFTSGSTGQPRRVIKPIACLDKEAALLAARFADRTGRVPCCCLRGAATSVRSDVPHLSADVARVAAACRHALLRRATGCARRAAPLRLYQQPGIFKTPRSPALASASVAYPLGGRHAAPGAMYRKQRTGWASGRMKSMAAPKPGILASGAIASRITSHGCRSPA